MAGAAVPPLRGAFACAKEILVFEPGVLTASWITKEKDSPAAVFFFGGPKGDRTPDLKIANLALSQLSYGPIFGWQVRPARLEYSFFPDLSSLFRNRTAPAGNGTPPRAEGGRRRRRVRPFEGGKRRRRGTHMEADSLQKKTCTT